MSNMIFICRDDEFYCDYGYNFSPPLYATNYVDINKK